MDDFATLAALEADLYRRLGFKDDPPDAVVTTRLRAYVNQTHREVLAQKGLTSLRQGIVFGTSVPGDPYLSMNQAVARVLTVVDRGNRIVLTRVQLSELRDVDPGRSDSSSVPYSYAVINLQAASTRLSTQIGMSVKSSDPADVGITAWANFIVENGSPGTEAVTVTGTTPVDLPSPWPLRTLAVKFYLDKAPRGFVTLHEGHGATGAVLAIIGSAYTTVQKTLLQLYPIPQTAIDYYADVELRINELKIAGDSPLLPQEFAWLLTSGALMKEWQRMEKTSQYDREKAAYLDGLADLKAFVARAVGAPERGQPSRPSQLGPWFGAGS